MVAAMCSSSSAVAVVLLSWLSSTANRVSALPSFGDRIPNGERVPCPPDMDQNECVRGFCRGLGHTSCGGHIISTDPLVGSPPVQLSSFGEDLRASGFKWTTDLCKLDSDGDGYTNGEELGDPCCVWTHGYRFGEAPYTTAHTPSHPGNPNDVLGKGYVPPRCGTEETSPPKSGEEEEDSGVTDTLNEKRPNTAAFRPRETQGMFELKMKEYPIPRVGTTYVDIVFNLPEDLPDIVHIVYGEAIISQPQHLHHFVITGCPERFNKSEVGILH